MNNDDGRANRERNDSARDERAARRGAAAATAGEGGNGGGSDEAAAGAAAAVAHLDADLPGAAFSADANDGASLPDAGSEFDELDREPDPTGIVDEALRTPAPAPPPPPTPARLLPPPPRTTPRLLPPPARHTPTSTTPAPGGGATVLSAADRARRDEAARRINSALEFAHLRLEQFAEEIRNFGDARSYVTVLEIVNLSRSEIHEALTTISAAPQLDREFPGLFARAIQEQPELMNEFRTLNKAAIKVLRDNQKQE